MKTAVNCDLIATVLEDQGIKSRTQIISFVKAITLIIWHQFQYLRISKVFLNINKCNIDYLTETVGPRTPMMYEHKFFCTVSARSHVVITQLLATKSVVWYLGVFINSHLKWSDHIKHITAKATRSLNVLRHSLYTCPTSVCCASDTGICFSSMVLTFIWWYQATGRYST